jgi:hypothetical protein
LDLQRCRTMTSRAATGKTGRLRSDGLAGWMFSRDVKSLSTIDCLIPERRRGKRISKNIPGSREMFKLWSHESTRQSQHRTGSTAKIRHQLASDAKCRRWNVNVQGFSFASPTSLLSLPFCHPTYLSLNILHVSRSQRQQIEKRPKPREDLFLFAFLFASFRLIMEFISRKASVR